MPFFAFQSDWEPAPRAALEGLSLIAIGDVHGHRGHLEMMLQRLGPWRERAARAGLEQHLVLIGDYVDRGPDNLGTLDLLMDIQAALPERVHFLRGNHDQYMIDAVSAADPDPETLELWLENGGDTTLQELGVFPDLLLRGELRRAMAVARERLGPRLDFLCGLEDARRFGPWVFAHAGINPSKRLEQQSRRALLCIREPFLEGLPWPHDFVVVHGHTIRGPEVLPHRVAIDSGAYRTGVLTAVELEGQRLRFLCISDREDLAAFDDLPGRSQPRHFSPLEPIGLG